MFKCDICEKEYELFEMGYIGNKNPKDESCNPLTIDWIQQCLSCHQNLD